MKKLILLSVFFINIFASSPKALSFVDAKKFSGLWYEMARTYNSYQKECVGSSVEYILEPDGSFDVYNRCFKNSLEGKLIEYNGTAKSGDGNSNIANLKMRYFYVFVKNYKIIYLDDEYKTAIVCDKEMDQVWIMSRSPNIAQNKLKSMILFLQKYMDTKRLIFTPQDPQGKYK